tara:strand:+ start:32544 stop:44975 length:12432 start_codon:yes stop_codon:yes gene_type:complete
MSIKKLFEDANKTNTYLAQTNEKDAFEPIESERNLKQKKISQERYVPQIDYSNPENFVKYGSARLYYESAFNRILDYYPYDGSEAEITKFHNDNLDIEEYILEKKYPKSNGYIILAKDGYSVSSKQDDYGIPTTNEYIDLKGGPGTGSANSTLLKDLLPNPYTDSRKESNLYSTDIYSNSGLPSDYGKGSRESNLRANFDDGVTVEFWMKTGSIERRGGKTGRQVIFDSWNNESEHSNKYSRLTIELTGTTTSDGGVNKRPFIVTIQSGANQPRSVDTMQLLGAASLQENMGDWNHYALRLYNTGSKNKTLKTELYVNGRRSDSSSFACYSLTSSLGLELTQRNLTKPDWFLNNTKYRYSSADTLQGWWRLNSSTITTDSPEPDSSGNNRTGSISAAAEAPATSDLTPSRYIQNGSNTFGADAADGINIGSNPTWDAIIGNAAGSTRKMTLAAWVYKTGDGGGSPGFGRIMDFGYGDISLFSDPLDRVRFSVKWDASSVVWITGGNELPFNEWHHVAVTYDANDPNADPKIYVDGVLESSSLFSGTKGGTYSGIAGGTSRCMIGNRYSDSTGADRNWEGNLADVAVWNSILSEDEIKSLYAAGSYYQPFDGITELNSKNMVARIGALVTSPNSSSAPAGAGRLTGSLDEFRYWKAARNEKQIGQYWFDQVRGGANSDISNADLGVYYKFNEGITNNSSIDSVVLDYAGRATNGTWTGYSSGARNTGSAILSASTNARSALNNGNNWPTKEFKDPVVRASHPDVVSLKSELITSGTSYDYNNNASLFSLMPGWVQDEVADSENSDLYYITHIGATYLDKLHLQISQLPNLRHLNYVSSSNKPLPFSKHLPQSLGLYSPELFIDADILENFADRGSEQIFQDKLQETKNQIYQNLYNNMAHIFKSKGTERSLRSLLRCLNIDNGLYRINVNSNNEKYTLTNNLKQTLMKKKFLNFNSPENVGGVIYQKEESSSPTNLYRGYIKTNSTVLDDQVVKKSLYHGFTCESNIVFPSYVSSPNIPSFERDSSYNRISLFGIEQVNKDVTDSLDGTITHYIEDRNATFRVYAVRDGVGSKNAYFHLTSSRTDGNGISLSSSVFLDVYDNEPWNLSIRVKPIRKYRAGVIPAGTATVRYKVVFSGYNPKTPDDIDSFVVSQSVSQTIGEQYITGSRRVFVGADRNDLTGTLNYKSDVLISSVAYWSKYMLDDDLKQHALDFENIGVSDRDRTLSPFDSGSVDITNKNALVLNWNFENVTTSDATGSFYTVDYSSGSSDLAMMASPGYVKNKGWNGYLSGFLYSGYGKGFANSSTEVVKEREINTYKFINPEHVVSSNMVQTFSDEDLLFSNLRKDEIVPNYVFSIEKSIYNAVSEQMLDFFAGAIDFHNLIGHPVHTYRHRYKEIDKLRQLFFERVQEVKQTEKFLNYYKWFDKAISTILSQFIPASAEFVDNMLNVVESHVLERNKYQNRLNIIDSNTFWRDFSSGISSMRFAGQTIPWEGGASATSLTSPPESPRNTNIGIKYWQTRAERSGDDITSGVAAIDAQREIYRKVIWSKPHGSSSLDKLFTVNGTQYNKTEFLRNNSSMTPDIRAYVDKASDAIYKWQIPEKDKTEIHGGVNFSRNKSLEYAYASVLPGGPVSLSGSGFVPLNVLVGLVRDSTELTKYTNVEWDSDFIRTREQVFKVQNARHWENGIGYKNTKSTFAFPFNVLSSSVEVRTGYNKDVIERVGRNLTITNLHNDAYGSMMEIPMQGPFTEEVVGGHQSRHISLNEGTDTQRNRAEAWRILLGTCTVVPSGAIGLVGPDYPPPTFNPKPGRPFNRIYPYPMHEKAYLYRDFIAKRPVNIKNINTKNSTNTKTLPGNFAHNYEVISSFGAFNNPRAFVEKQPTLPAQVSLTSDTTNVRTILNNHRREQNHFETIGEYSTSYLTGTTNKSIVVTRFAAPGGIEVETRGYQDFKSSEYSPYNSLAYRNLTVKKPSQGPSGSFSEPRGGSPSTSRVYDIHGRDYGLNSHRARHAAKFGRDSLTPPIITYDLGKSMRISAPTTYTYNYSSGLQAWWRLNKNVSTAGVVEDSSGNGRTGSFAAASNRPAFSSTLFPGKFIQTGSCTFDGGAGADDSTSVGSAATWDAIIGNDTGNGSTQKMTLSAWIRPLSDGEGNFGRVIDFGAQDVAIFVGGESGGSAYLYYSAKFTGGTGTWNTSSRVITLNQWTHIAVTFDASSASNDPIIYINGTAVNISENATPSGNYDGITTSTCHIGNTANGTRTFDGQIVDVAVWNNILSSANIQAIYQVANVSYAESITGTTISTPGESYDQLPAMFKINRNRKALIRGYTTSEVFNRNNITNAFGLLMSGSSTTGQKGKLYHGTAFKDSTGQSWTGKKFTLSAWVYLGKGLGNQESILTLGDNGQATHRDQALGWHLDNQERPELWIQTSVGNKAKWRQTTALVTGSWYHLAVVYDGGSSANVPTFYMNGASQSMTLYNGSMTSSMESINGRGAGKSFIGASNRNNITMIPFVYAAFDEIAIYDDTFSSSEISTLYSSGKILDLTASFAPKTSSLATWLRLGDNSGDPTTNAVMTQSSGVGPIFYDAKGNNNYQVVAGSTANIQLYMISSSYEIAPVSTANIPGVRDSVVTYSSSMYDNFNVSRQIPRSDRQYLWISNSVVDVSNTKYAGFQYSRPGPSVNLDTRFGFRSSSSGMLSYWDFVSSSSAKTGSFFQPTNRLNIIINDPVDRTAGTIGTLDVSSLINDDLVGNTPATVNPDYLNQLLAARGANYGWGWNMFYQGDNPVTRAQKQNNSITFVDNTSTMTSASYRLPPLSLKGRRSMINYSYFPGGGSREESNTTLKIGNTNQKIFFSERDFNEYANINLDAIFTPLHSVLDVVHTTNPKYNLNWVQYTQNIFPSMRNEFVSSSSRRLDFDNKYWRTIQADRIALGNTLPNSFNIRNVGGSENLLISQSSWVLDAPVNFLTRSSVLVHTGSGDLRKYNWQHTQAGELQNTYFKYITVPANFLKAGAMYARTHELDTMTSVVSPQGPRIPETGSITPRGSASFAAAKSLKQPFGGEAVWEAGTQAGVIGKGLGGQVFASASSEPWFGTYDEFNDNLRLKAKGFAVIPEFRMSEQVNRYSKYGYMNPTVDNMLEIPGTVFSSTTASFYKDFSNTDFLQDFLGIKVKTLMDAKEIRLSCTGAIKYNAYDGFYPAQRTVKLVSQFSSSYAENLAAWTGLEGVISAASDGVGFFLIKGSTQLKNLADGVFSPGILYNSIKSGIAVDYPFIHDPSKRYTGSFGGSATPTNNYALIITGSNPSGSNKTTGYNGGMIWDRRMPFEAIINPEDHLPGYKYYSMESHPSMSLINYTDIANQYLDAYVTMEPGGDNVYSMMASNFFGQATSFFLKESGLTKLKSKTITDDLQFSDGEVYMSRIKLRRSHNGARTYDFEYDSRGQKATNGDRASVNVTANTSSAWGRFGARVITSGSSYELHDSVYPVPQDPKRNPGFYETFTMYSRPTAFGPSCAGRPTGSNAVSGAFRYAALDSFEGYNPAFTPPYTNGEAWADLIFRPTAGISYDLERILAETQVICWRFDAGYKVQQPPFDRARAEFDFSGMSSSMELIEDSEYKITTTDGSSLTYVMKSGSTAGTSGSSGIRFNYIEHAADGPDATFALTQLSAAINSNAGHNAGTPGSKIILNKNTTHGVLQLTQSLAGRLGESEIERNFRARVNGIRTSSFFSRARPEPAMPALIPVEKALLSNGTVRQSPNDDYTMPSIYDGYRINVNSMQLTSSLEIFGIERILEQTTGKFNQIGESINKTVGKKWIISPKWECPMMNFSDKGVHPIKNAAGTLTLPQYASASVPRGMWHQFGILPTDPKTGVFMEIGMIPEEWLRNHYDVRINPTIYNNYDPKNSQSIYKKAKSLAKLCGFDGTNSSVRLGELKEKTVIKEAIVAIPYVLDALGEAEFNKLSINSDQRRDRKKLISIPKDRFKSALKENEGSLEGDSLEIAGASIRKMVKAMEQYVLPPQFDFLNNPDIDPFAMYIFEFNYELDKDDLSYIWQNMAPRDYKKLEFQAASISHNLGDGELINHEVLENQNLRWMVFKVKQRAKDNYYDLLPDVVGGSTKQIDFQTGQRGEYQFGFNWPYDYLSFVELIKMDVDILLKK